MLQHSSLKVVAALSVVLGVTSLGCSLKKLGVRTTAEILENGLVTFESEPDPILAREAAAAQIKLMEALHRADPKNERVLLGLTRALGGYAFGFLEWEAEDDPKVRIRQAKLYKRGADFGLTLLNQNLGNGTLEAARGPSIERWEKQLQRADKDDVPALFWTGYCWAGSIRKAASSPQALAELPRAVSLIERVLELNPGYHYGAAHLFMGVYYADRPRLLGGDPKKALKHFSEAIRLSSEKYVMGKYLSARYHAVQTQDSRRFNKLLTSVLSSPDDILPEQRLSQEIARIWARKLMERKDDYIIGEN